MKPSFDLRVCLFLTGMVAILTLFMEKEFALFLLLMVLACWLLLHHFVKEALSHLFWYGFLFGAMFLVKDIPILGTTGLPLVTLYIRRIMLSVMVARPLLASPNGQLVATFHGLKFPQIVTISITLMFRFLPTISEEYRQIREAQLFRDIGGNFFKIARHPIRYVEYTLVPMLVRVSKTADELAAAAAVRSVGSSCKINCYHKLTFTVYDGVIGFIFATSILIIFLFEEIYLQGGLL
ncbi:MAG: energy-coupling factor transporter transmembrane component T [Eubacteriales bacterium]